MMNQPGGQTADPYVDWDAAYVFGALSASERQEYQAHLAGCTQCSAEVAELAGMPGLLGRVDAADVEALLAGGDAPLDVERPVDLVARIEQRAKSGPGDTARHRLRTWVVAGVAAALVAAVAVGVPVALNRPASPAATATLSQTTASPLSADVELFTETSGTRIMMSCSYAESGNGQGEPGQTWWKYYLFVVGKDGVASPVGSWKAQPGMTVPTQAHTSLLISQIKSVQVRSAKGAVLLSADLG